MYVYQNSDFQNKTGAYKSTFHNKNWNESTFEEKLQALQFLENDYANKQGRNACEVKAEKMPHISYSGYYNPEDNTIYINEEHLLDSNANKIFNYLSVDTILHEGRHAYQHNAIKNENLHDDQKQVEVWKMNFNNNVYMDPRKGYLYRMQSLERDANDYSAVETEKIFNDLEKKYGPNEGYDKYKENIRDNYFIKNEELAKNTFGDSYKEKIDRLVQLQYEIDQAKYQEVVKYEDINKSSALKDVKENKDFFLENRAYNDEVRSSVLKEERTKDKEENVVDNNNQTKSKILQEIRDENENQQRTEQQHMEKLQNQKYERR